MRDYQNNNEPFYGGRKSMVFERKKTSTFLNRMKLEFAHHVL